MKLAFNQATTLKNSNLSKDLELCEKHGYDFIEIRTMDKLPEYLETASLEDLNNYFQSTTIKPLALNALVFFNNQSKEEYEVTIQTFKDMLETAKAIGAPYIVAVPLVTKEKFLKSNIHTSCVSVLKELSTLASPYEVKIALEFVGHPECTVNTLSQAYKIIEEVNCDNVGLVLDCFHFHAMGSRLEDLQKVDISKIFIVHIDDTEDFPIGFLTDEDRVWPGEGAIDLQGIFSILKEKRYDGVVSVELFRPDYYNLDAEVVIKKAKQTTNNVLAKMGV